MSVELKVYESKNSPTSKGEGAKTSTSESIGAVLIVAGTTTGAGMLALPMTSNKIGFANSLILLVVMWAFMCLTALISVDASLKHGGGYSVAYLAERSFGKWGKRIASLGMGLLFYALLSAYTAGGASFLKMGVKNFTGISVPVSLAAVVFTVALGSFVCSSTRHADFANRFLLLFKIGVFLTLVYFLFPFVRVTNLVSNALDENAAFLTAIPIFFTSFGFHGSIPSLINYAGANRRVLRKVVIIGSLLPLLIYILWQIVTLGVLPEETIDKSAGADVAAFVNLLNNATGSEAIGYFSNIFAFFGVATSFLGVSIGLFDYLAEAFNGKESPRHRLRTAALTFAPPLFFALFFQNGFVAALGYAAIALSVLAVLLPTAIALKQEPKAPTRRRVFLIAAFALGVGVIVIELVK